MTPPADSTPNTDVPDGDAFELENDARGAEQLDALLARRLTPRQRATRAGVIVTAVLLTFTLLCALVPEVRLSVQRAVFGPTAVPTSPITSGADVLWFTPLAPGETITLDDHALSILPPPGDPHPLRLSRGAHQFAWRATPFEPQQCLLTVPHSPADTCPTTPALAPATLPAGRILNVSESLATLSDTQRLALSTAINVALATTYDASVQSGEFYRSLSANDFSPIRNPTQQPLHASLRFVEQPGWIEPCAVISLVPCRAQGQDCERLCTLAPAVATNLARAPTRYDAGSWYAGLTAGLLWTYTTADGQVIEQGAPDTAFNFTLLVLRIIWDGAHWSVIPVLGATPGFAAAQDSTCGALANDLDAWVELDVTHAFVDVRSAVRYAAESDPTDGCVGVVSATSSGNDVTPTAVTGTPPLLLHRFGVLLAANASAHDRWPDMPLADAAESALAARMAAA